MDAASVEEVISKKVDEKLGAFMKEMKMLIVNQKVAKETPSDVTDGLLFDEDDFIEAESEEPRSMKERIKQYPLQNIKSAKDIILENPRTLIKNQDDAFQGSCFDTRGGGGTSALPGRSCVTLLML